VREHPGTKRPVTCQSLSGTCQLILARYPRHLIRPRQETARANYWWGLENSPPSHEYRLRYREFIVVRNSSFRGWGTCINLWYCSCGHPTVRFTRGTRQCHKGLPIRHGGGVLCRTIVIIWQAASKDRSEIHRIQITTLKFCMNWSCQRSFTKLREIPPING
jgi:hypothetical protein